MNNARNVVRKSLLKREEVLNKFEERKKAFLLSKEKITNDIEEARNIWKTTLAQLSRQEFDK
ncbi:MAG: hypothetical protein WCM93_05830 [Bacteroidota bacterium]